MSRCPKLEAILEAKYRFENAAPGDQARLRSELETLLNEVLAERTGTGMTSRRLEDSLRDVYREFTRAKRREERAKLSRIR
ncbi:hypothetical protein LBMAG56_00610 [Verrucomicrobiota bacterium]|nr:hypothetical protein LBMAG56_00610 [Verrucomicrobiota bacterium]